MPIFLFHCVSESSLWLKIKLDKRARVQNFHTRVCFWMIDLHKYLCALTVFVCLSAENPNDNKLVVLFALVTQCCAF